MYIPFVELEENNLKVDFVIKKMEEIYEDGNDILSTPHQHNFYTIIWTNNAYGKHMIDFKEYDLKPNTVYFIHPNQVHHIDTNDKPYGYVIMFSESFLYKTGVPKMFIHQLSLLKEIGTPSVYEVKGRELIKINEIIEPLCINYKENSPFKSEKTCAYITLLLISIYEMNPTSNIFLNNPSVDILIDFKSKVDENFSQIHKVTEYAKLIEIDSSQLNDAVRKFTGYSAKEFIQNKLLLEAKKLAFFSDLNSKEIGFKLGFEDPSHFSKFFKTQTQVSFKDFQKEKI